ncbi:hypothetical protein PENTCL1PPCAC_5133, partial [Pristionchus entomophagus]
YNHSKTYNHNFYNHSKTYNHNFYNNSKTYYHNFYNHSKTYNHNFYNNSKTYYNNYHHRSNHNNNLRSLQVSSWWRLERMGDDWVMPDYLRKLQCRSKNEDMHEYVWNLSLHWSRRGHWPVRY